MLFGTVVIEASCGLVRIGPELIDFDPVESPFLDVPGSTTFSEGQVIVASEPFAPTAATVVDIQIDVSDGREALRVRSLRAEDRVRRGRSYARVRGVFSAERVPTWDRWGLLAVVDSERVLGLFGRANRVLPKAEGADRLYVRFVVGGP